jgi:DNA-binding FadR family transcriptional regulator
MRDNDITAIPKTGLSMLTARDELTIDSTPAERAVVQLRQSIDDLLQAHTGLEGVGYAIAGGHSSPQDTESLGFAVASLAGRVADLTQDIELRFYEVLQALTAKEVQS